MYPQGLYSMNLTGLWIDEQFDLFTRRATWELKFIWWPKRCSLSNQRLWLCWAYKGTAMYTGPGEPVFEHRYHTKVEHLIWKLKGN